MAMTDSAINLLQRIQHYNLEPQAVQYRPNSHPQGIAAKYPGTLRLISLQ